MSLSARPPVACCLSAGEYQSRIAWIESLARKSLREHVRDGLVLRLIYKQEAAGEVRRMVEQKRQCCAFLAFDLEQQPDAVCVAITAPEAAREAADGLFGQFLAGQATTQRSAQNSRIMHWLQERRLGGIRALRQHHSVARRL